MENDEFKVLLKKHLPEIFMEMIRKNSKGASIFLKEKLYQLENHAIQFYLESKD